MQAITAFFTAMVAFFASLFGCAGNPIAQTTPDEFTPVLRFFVCSDTHINGTNDSKRQRIESALDYCYNYAAGSESYTKLDAAMFVGDVTDNGTDEQFAAAKETLTNSVKEGTTLLAIAADHHDGYVGKSCLDSISDITGLDSDFHVVINGYHFIGLSTSKYENIHYATYQRIWLRKQLEEAVADDPEKPIFVCQHEHIWNTVYGSSTYEGWGIIDLTDILNDYPQVVDFSGHSHYPLNDPRSVWQGSFTCVGTGSMNYMEFTIGLDRSIRPDEGRKAAQAWIVEVDADNNILLTGFDVINREVLCKRYLPSVMTTGLRPYTEANSKALASAPEFASDAAITVSGESKAYTVTVPEAHSTDGNIIETYRIEVYSKAGIKLSSDYVLNNYWLNDTYDTITFEVDAKAGCTVKVTAENAYQMASEPLTAVLG